MLVHAPVSDVGRHPKTMHDAPDQCKEDRVGQRWRRSPTQTLLARFLQTLAVYPLDGMRLLWN